MKKLISIIISSALVFILAGCASDGDHSSALVGKWKYELNSQYRDAITEVILDKEVYDVIYYEFNADGTGAEYSNNQPEKMTFEYSYDGKIITMCFTGGEPFETECRVHGDTMSITEGEEKVDFTRAE